MADQTTEIPSFFKEASEALLKESQNPKEPIAEKQDTPAPEEKAPEEKPVEVPEPKATEKPTEEKPAPTPAPAEKEWYEDEAESPAAKLDNLKKDDLTKELETFKSKAKEYEDALEDPIIKMLIETKKNKGDVLATLNSLKEVDYDKYTPDQLFEVELSKADLTDEEKEQEREDFKNLSPLNKKKQADATRKELKAEQAEKLKGLSLDNSKKLERQQQIVQKADAELDTYTNDLVGKNFLGVPVTKEMIEELKNDVQNGFNIARDDGFLNIPYLFQLHFEHKYLKTIVKANIAKAKDQGRKEVLDTVENPSKMPTEQRRATEKSDEKTEDEKQVNAFVHSFRPPQPKN